MQSRIITRPNESYEPHMKQDHQSAELAAIAVAQVFYTALTEALTEALISEPDSPSRSLTAVRSRVVASVYWPRFQAAVQAGWNFQSPHWPNDLHREVVSGWAHQG